MSLVLSRIDFLNHQNVGENNLRDERFLERINSLLFHTTAFHHVPLLFMISGKYVEHSKLLKGGFPAVKCALLKRALVLLKKS